MFAADHGDFATRTAVISRRTRSERYDSLIFLDLKPICHTNFISIMWLWLLCAAAAVYSAEGAGPGAARLVCYVEGARASDVSECTHLVYAGDSRGEALDDLLKEYRKNNPRIKIILRVNEGDKVCSFSD